MSTFQILKTDSLSDNSQIIGIELEYFLNATPTQLRTIVSRFTDTPVNNWDFRRQFIRQYVLQTIPELQEFIHSIVIDGVMDELIFHPMSLNFLRAHQDSLELLRKLKEEAPYTSLNNVLTSGLHFNLDLPNHYDASKFAKNFVTFMNTSEILLILISGRKGHAQRFVDLQTLLNYTSLDEMPSAIRVYALTNAIEKIERSLSLRQHAHVFNVNFCPTIRPKTVEYRWFCTTFNYRILMARAEFTAALHLICFEGVVKDMMSLIIFIEKHSKDYPFIYKFLKQRRSLLLK